MLKKNLEHITARLHESEVRIEIGQGDLPLLVVETPLSSATISLYGGQVLQFTPTGEAPVLWVSRQRYAQVGQAIRGGIPVCWPWFGPHPTKSEFPNHGFARTQDWLVDSSKINDDGSVTIQLRMEPGKASQSLWNYDCQLTQRIHIGEALGVDVMTSNQDSIPVVVTEALHTYFAVQDIREVKIRGLENQTFIDNLVSSERLVQDGPVVFAGETESFYTDHGPTCWIDDEAGERTIRVDKRGSRSTVVWNPWIDKAAATKDMADDEYLQMLCIETANIGDNEVTIPPGQTHTMGVSIRVES
jgi:D-hexose-6-phosphate mutarotase